jgi:hypothetical protein
MDSEPFRETCSLANEQESQRAYYLPSLAEIEVLKRQIRAEKEAKQAVSGGPLYLNLDRQPRTLSTNHYGQRRKHPPA